MVPIHGGIWWWEDAPGPEAAAEGGVVGGLGPLQVKALADELVEPRGELVPVDGGNGNEGRGSNPSLQPVR